MILSIHQPSYFPWLGLLNKIAKSDVYMVMDEVQLSDSAFQNRNIFLCDGKSKFLTISFNKKDYLKRRFCDLEITKEDWRDQHLNTLKSYYGKHRYYPEIIPYITPVFQNTSSLLVDPVVQSMEICMRLLDIPTKVTFQRQMEYDRETKKNDLVLALVASAGADVYLAGTGSKDYMQLDTFAAKNIKVVFNNFQHPTYTQRNAEKFEPGISSLDLLFNVGIEKAREIFWQALRAEPENV